MGNDLRGYSLPLKATCDLVTETCYECGILFAMPSDHKQRLLENKAKFYCPNGHGQVYTGPTEAEKLEKQLKAKERELERERAAADRARDARERAENSLRTTKGHLTRVKKRVGRGVCPCCNRQFKNLARHMEHKHPKFVDGNISPELRTEKARG